MAENIIDIVADTWDKTADESKGLLVVYFYGPYCGHCTMFTPIFEAVAAEMGDKAKFAKVNCFENMSLATNCSIRATPTILIYKDGQECDRYMGAETKEALSARITKCAA